MDSTEPWQHDEVDLQYPIGRFEFPRVVSSDDREFLGTLTLKHPSFRVAVEGRDEGGYPYQRLLPRLIQVQAAPPKE